MKGIFLFMLCIVCVLCATVQGKVTINNYIDGYYWRDYTGYIPSDAIPAGRDENGETTFIGQALHPGGHLTPGWIRRNNNKVFYEYGNSLQSATEDVKILCSQNPERLIWIQVETGRYITNLNGHLILGGHDRDRPLAIGRKLRENNEVAVGKVVITESKFERLYTTQNTKGRYENSYEVLVYNHGTVKEDLDYYWRDYTGYIPSDAIPAGRDENGETTYIGQALHPGGDLTPGWIRSNNNKVFYEYGHLQHSATEDAKILCSQHPERLMWIKVETKKSIDTDLNDHLIIGGYDRSRPLAIGRKARENNEVAVGKVLLVGSEFERLYSTQNEGGREETTYEVLVYNPSITFKEDLGRSQKIINFFY